MTNGEIERRIWRRMNMGFNVGKIYYTPVNSPDNVKVININNANGIKIVKDFISKNINRKKDPNVDLLKSSGINDITIIKKFKESYPNCKSDDAKAIFDHIQSNLHGPAKSSDKYFCIIIFDDLLYIYHFKPESGATFENNSISTYIKYLDQSSMNWAILISSFETLSKYCDCKKDKFDVKDEVIFTYQKQRTKGFIELTSVEPTYDYNGDLKIICRYNSESNIIIDTQINYFDDISAELKINFEKGTLQIGNKILNISEINIAGKKYDIKDSNEIKNRIYYKSERIDMILKEIQYKIRNSENKYNYIEEKLYEINLLNDNKVIKKISKRNSELSKGQNIYLMPKIKNVKYYNLNKDLSIELRNGNKLSFLELSRYNSNYDKVIINNLTIFCKMKPKEEYNLILKQLNYIIKSLDVKKSNNSYVILFTLIGIIILSKYIKDKDIANKLYLSSQEAISNILSLLNEGVSMDIKEIDSLNIDLKAGVIKNKEKGFFDNSAKKMSEKILKKLKSRSDGLIFYLIGINEDTKDFSLVPLSRMRNEYLETLIKIINSTDKYNTVLCDSIPVTNTEGILMLVVKKSN